MTLNQIINMLKHLKKNNPKLGDVEMSCDVSDESKRESYPAKISLIGKSEFLDGSTKPFIDVTFESWK